MGSSTYTSDRPYVRAKPVEITPGTRNYKCDVCGEPCFYDGRCGDGPILMCTCNKAEDDFWANDRR